MPDHALPRNSDLTAALVEARETYAAARPVSAALHAEARAVMPGGNTRSVLFWTPFPTAMVRGEGCRLWDADGHEYVDFCGEYSAGLFGHSDPRILAALRGALDSGLNLAGVGANEVRLAALLCARFPAMERVRFTNSGTEANLMALTAARAATGRAGVLVFRGGYHGGVLTFPAGQPMQAVNLPIPVQVADYNDAEGAVALLEGGGIGAVIVEPMLGAGGCIPADPAFLAALREGCDRTGALLIFDEVMTSRHHAGGLQMRLGGVRPDLMTLGKYVAGGMSFGAFGGRAAVMDQFDGHRPGTLPHAGTFNNNVLSMAAGLVAMGEIFTAEAADALWARGEALRARLNEVAAGAGMVFTGAGSMVTPHFRPGKLTRPPTTASAEEEQRRELFFLDMLAGGIYLARRGMVTLSLPMTAADTEAFVAAVSDFCEARRPLLAVA
ncbi:glutamate-1-semialdehyde 2,1-aminomutase [Humitalea rosea]|uniref:Glutamate-1-semialdehyde 2,1-aminomutase n=1 Tax=Humitalea rosea TaxID=990373 RepID=A0A2W7IQJ8_9PROT|nr:aminotransferase class III-fold pyridoxal phosphate-dependent enzyme [Humitalea rosea]PZW48148.1 glutamate-1-semialdehyde 2,1-aminomutase [Humitalea rosea]